MWNRSIFLSYPLLIIFWLKFILGSLGWESLNLWTNLFCTNPNPLLFTQNDLYHKYHTKVFYKSHNTNSVLFITDKWPPFMPHQLNLAPGDTVTGNAAEVTASRDLDFGSCCALLLILWCQHLQETIWEILLRPHLHIHTDTNQILIMAPLF